ncbi:hypothetical protein KJY77_06580 [Canibacter sp. lx-72]|uniref:hypothetical protein n=1 Tax=Canibacter zhuwentaonis TaxID=2837491 RepID=UPI001BDC3B9B|nr:hypothetical protein [Canibacter zhuwentaonis]MBT1018794.1 hypothetical protein [Canibacter zhuwentaonis]MBT1035969.1 hypothetical protein [Canibacter zhuwentaonis]
MFLVGCFVLGLFGLLFWVYTVGVLGDWGCGSLFLGVVVWFSCLLAGIVFLGGFGLRVGTLETT